MKLVPEPQLISFKKYIILYYFVTVVCGIFCSSFVQVFEHLASDKLEKERIERRISRCNGLSGAGDRGFDVGLPSVSPRND